MAIRASARSRMERPRNSATPYSVTMVSARFREMEYGSTWRQHDLDAGDRTALCGGGEGDDSPATLGMQGAKGKVRSAAGAAPLHRTDGLRANLAGEIHFQRRIHRDHVILLSDDKGIVGVGSGHDPAGGGLGKGFVQVIVAQGKAGDAFTRVNRLVSAGHIALLYEIRHGRGEQLRVNAQVVTGEQVLADGIGQSTDSQLESVAVVDHVCDISANGLVGGGGLGARNGENWRIRRIAAGHPLDGNLYAAPNPPKPGIDLQNHRFGTGQRFPLEHLTVRNLEVAVLVHVCDLGDEHIVGLVGCPQRHIVMKI